MRVFKNVSFQTVNFFFYKGCTEKVLKMWCNAGRNKHKNTNIWDPGNMEINTGEDWKKKSQRWCWGGNLRMAAMKQTPRAMFQTEMRGQRAWGVIELNSIGVWKEVKYVWGKGKHVKSSTLIFHLIPWERLRKNHCVPFTHTEGSSGKEHRSWSVCLWGWGQGWKGTQRWLLFLKTLENYLTFI